jgi:hypothetical protein
MAETFKRAGIDAEAFANAQLDQKLIMVSEAFNRRTVAAQTRPTRLLN